MSKIIKRIITMMLVLTMGISSISVANADENDILDLNVVVVDGEDWYQMQFAKAKPSKIYVVKDSYADRFVTGHAGQIYNEFEEKHIENLGKCGEYMHYIITTDGELVLLGEGDMDNYDSPEDAPWSKYGAVIRSVELSRSIESIGKNAFSSCSNILEISYPCLKDDDDGKYVNNIKRIGDNAFYDISILKYEEASDTEKAVSNYVGVLSEVTNLFDLTVKMPEGYVDSTLWIDGVPHQSSIDGENVKVTDLTDGTSKIAIMYKYKSTGAPLGMTVWSLEYSNGSYVATEMQEFKDVLSGHGFSIRVTGNTGIRYMAGLDKEFKNKLKTVDVDGYKIIEAGILYLPEKLRKTQANENGLDFIYENLGKGKVVNSICLGNGKDMVSKTENGRELFSAVLTKIPANQYNVTIAFRSYMILEKDGEQTIIYNAPVQKSLYTCSKQILELGQFSPGSPQYNFIKDIVDNQ